MSEINWTEVIKSFGMAAGAVFVVYLFLRYTPWKNGNGRRKTAAGDLDPADWEARITRIVTSVIDDKFEMVAIRREEEMARMVRDTVSQVFAVRNEQIRQLLRDELRSFYGLRGSTRWKGEEHE